MTKREALYFLEGLVAGIAAPNPDLVKGLCCLLAQQYDITPADMDEIRIEVDHYLDQAEDMEKGQ
jgi:hypothetical protein